jgi:dTDP-4-dehydrorhamnose 3,5-epimerase
MKVRELALPGVFEIVPDRFGDDRGFFSETYSARRFAEAGLPTTWVQDNHSLSRPANVLRGLHFQTAPFRQKKLVRVFHGAILDMVVDIRPDSPTFKQWLAIEISAEAWNQVLVPEGMAHGFLTRVADTEVLYKVSAPYSPEHDRSIRYDDPDLGIAWPLGGVTPVLSRKDAEAPLLRDFLAGPDRYAI